MIVTPITTDHNTKQKNKMERTKNVLWEMKTASLTY